MCCILFFFFFSFSFVSQKYRGVTHVINFEFPTGGTAIELYTHRIGRTGRAGRDGLATTLVTQGDQDMFYDLNQFLLKSPNHEAAPEFKNHDMTKFGESKQRERK